MTEKCGVEVIDSTLAIRIASRFHFLEYERMTANRTLSEDDQTASENICALDRDRYRYDLIPATEVILRAEADAFTAVYIHGVVRDHTTHLGNVVLQHGGWY